MGKLIIVGLGPGGDEHITVAGLQAMKNHEHVYLRTERHPVVSYLKTEGIRFKTFDAVYEEVESFQGVYDQITNQVLTMMEQGDVVYAVPGNPYVAETTVQQLIKKCDELQLERKVYPAMSFVDAMFVALELDPVDGFQLVDGLQLEEQRPDPSRANIITQVYDPFIASEVKLRLMDYYDDEQEIFVVKGAGIPGVQRIEQIPLYQLDRLDWIDYLTSVFIPRIDSPQKKYYNMNNLIEIMERLRGKDGCPWDVEQTHESLKPYLIEEAYEVLETIDEKDDFGLEEELGDLLLQVVFHAQVAHERGAFRIQDVIEGICQKLVFRHPHVFGEVEAEDSTTVLKNWEALKKEEKQITSLSQSMKSIPKELPALMRAYKIQKKAKQVGFDWPDVREAVEKVHEELQELLEAKAEGEVEHIQEESGDLLFAVVNVLRFFKVDPEVALNKTNQKFVKRLHYIEEAAKSQKLNLEDMTLEEMDILWEKAKKNE
ncbi:MazG family protein [Alkaliphilus metalliredigens QYMF]|uniref:MazG family protein n=1 Tax=Alkaliphilus metalliredigens (strain QYMF) TaxID=293826 RepID=A6TJN3_ALKMQ|nr:nucleoside triphosphate pyrophosphohydrolase [Alkaliphilus metalliredigens]ABR46401.1 MazG family protein [Alkaliphilus metalliredigens QYMF]